MTDKLQYNIRSTIKNLISERPKRQQSRRKLDPIITRGAYGSGGAPSSAARGAKARAENDPQGLMKDLGIRNKQSGDDLDAALAILTQAISSNKAMDEAYTAPKKVELKTKNGEDGDDGKTIEAIAVPLAVIDYKNGIRFIDATLQGAINARMLTLVDGIRFLPPSISKYVPMFIKQQ